MRVLIYFLCFFAASVLKVAIFQNRQPGAIPMVLIYVVAFLLAETLCKAVDKRRGR